MGTAQEEMELDQMAQAELSRLQRQYRIMEEDRQSYAEEMRTLLTRQRRQITSLEQEKKQLEMSPEMAQLKAARRQATRSGRSLIRKLDKQEELENNLKAERDQISDLKLQISRLEREIETQRRGGESEMSRREALKSAQRAERLLGDRLHHASVRFNSLLAENKQLRAELDHLLNERRTFNALYSRLNERLAQGRKLAAELTDQATQAYDQREEAQARLQALREQARIDAERHNGDMSVLQRQLDSVSKLYNFLGTKGQRRTTAHLEAQEALKQMSQREAQEKLLQAYSVSLEQVRNFCGEQDPDKLAALFTKQEEENFALFNYVNELNNELEVLEEQVESLKRAVEQQKGQQERRERQRQSTLAELEARLSSATNEANTAVEQLKQDEAELNEWLAGIQVLFNIVYSDSAPILQLLGERPEVTPSSVGLFLELLQERCAVLMKQATRSYSSEADDRASSIASPPRQQKRASFNTNYKRASSSAKEDAPSPA